MLYAAFVVYGATIPFNFHRDVQDAIARLHELPLNPFVSPDTGRRLSIPDVTQNVLLFLPFGALGFMAGRKSAGIGRVLFVTAAGLALALLVETLQLFTTDRTSSTADVLTNTAGAFAGAVLALTAGGVVKRSLWRLEREGMVVPELRPLLVTAGVLLIAWCQPFDVTLEVGAVAGKVRALEQDVLQFSGFRDEGMAIVIAALFAMTLAGYLSVLGEKRAAAKTLALGAVAIVGLEASQLAIESRMPGAWDALVGVVGVLAGVAIWSSATVIVWPRLWFAVIVIGTIGAASMQMLSPFTLAEDYRPISWFPFLGYYSRTTFETLSHVIELGLIYFPMGFWIGSSGVERRRAMWLAAGAALAIAMPIEVLQGYVSGRYPDVSDIALSLIGAAAGASLGNWAMRGRELA